MIGKIRARPDMHHLRKGITRRAVHRQSKRLAGSVSVDGEEEDEAREAQGDGERAEGRERLLDMMAALEAAGKPGWALAADAVDRLLREALPDCSPGESRYSFVLNAVIELGRGDPTVPLGDVALRLGVYPLMAYFFLNGASGEGSRGELEEVLHQAEWLDRALPVSGGVQTQALCCAIPFVHDLRMEMRPADAEHVMRALRAGDGKRVRYLLSWHRDAGRGGESGESASESASESSGPGDDSSDDSDSDSGTDSAAAVFSLRPLRPALIRNRVSLRELLYVFRRVGSNSRILALLDLMAAQSGKLAGGAAGSRAVKSGNPYWPPVEGSLMRAYLREVHGLEG
jgi:hypothetical protein